MKLVTLNTWGGRVHKPLLKFLSENKDIDIFCFQEIYHNATKEVVGSDYHDDALNLHNDISDILLNHLGYFRPSFGESYGLSIFVKKEIQVIGEGDLLIYEVQNYITGGNHPRNLHWVEINKDGESLTVINVHGLWNGNGKTDTPDRLEQSRRIKDFMDSIKGKKILCGDFNLLPDTESVKLLESGMKNLVKEYGVTSTRSALYTKPIKFADYIFVSKDIEVKDFKVLLDEVSDHLPLLVEF